MQPTNVHKCLCVCMSVCVCGCRTFTKYFNISINPAQMCRDESLTCFKETAVCVCVCVCVYLIHLHESRCVVCL